MAFWSNEFTKKMTADDFRKGYRYNIRHAYGKEGKRADYTPHSCQKIILGSQPGTGETHGCPFKHFDERALRLKLAKLRVSSRDVDTIVEDVKGRNYQVACRRHFEVTHSGFVDTDGVGNHPNAWFEKSREFHRENSGSASGGSDAAAKATASTPPSAPSIVFDS